MIGKLAVEHYHRVKHLFPERQPVIHAVLDGINRGGVWVDDVEAPRTAVVWARAEMTFLAGDRESRLFAKAFSKLLDDEILPLQKAAGEHSFQLHTYPEEAWAPLFEAWMPGKALKRYDRWNSTWDPAEYREKVAVGTWEQLPDGVRWNSPDVPEGYEIRRVDVELVERDREGILRREIETYWGSVAQFEQHGFGYAALCEGQVVSCCQTVFATSNGDVEIGINTYNPTHRKKGLATLVARAVLDHCLAEGRHPFWQTEVFRVDSIVIAEKLGFRQLRIFPCWYLPLPT